MYLRHGRAEQGVLVLKRRQRPEDAVLYKLLHRWPGARVLLQAHLQQVDRELSAADGGAARAISPAQAPTSRDGFTCGINSSIAYICATKGMYSIEYV